MVARLQWYLDPPSPHQLKKNKTKKTSKLDTPDKIFWSCACHLSRMDIRNKGEFGSVKHDLAPPLPRKFLTDRFNAMPYLWIFFITCVSCLSVILTCLLPATLWSPVWKGLTSWRSFMCIFVTFPYGVLGQVLYLIVTVSIPDLCLFSYFYNESVLFSLNFRLESGFSNQTLRKHVTSWDIIQLFQCVNFSLEMHARTS